MATVLRWAGTGFPECNNLLNTTDAACLQTVWLRMQIWELLRRS